MPAGPVRAAWASGSSKACATSCRSSFDFSTTEAVIARQTTTGTSRYILLNDPNGHQCTAWSGWSTGMANVPRPRSGNPPLWTQPVRTSSHLPGPGARSSHWQRRPPPRTTPPAPGARGRSPLWWPRGLPRAEQGQDRWQRSELRSSSVGHSIDGTNITRMCRRRTGTCY